MSDLQCAATILIARDGAGDVLADAVRRRRIACVYASPGPEAVRTGEVVGAELGTPVRVRDGLSARTEGTLDDLIARFREALEEISDLHRGETVLAVSHEPVIRQVIPRLTSMRDVSEGERTVAEGALVEVAIDADDWRCDAWPDPTR